MVAVPKSDSQAYPATFAIADAPTSAPGGVGGGSQEEPPRKPPCFPGTQRVVHRMQARRPTVANTWCLLCAGNALRTSFTSPIDPHHHPVNSTIFSPFNKQGKWGPGLLNWWLVHPARWQSGDSWICALSLYPIFCPSKQRWEVNF